mmetsp:Transcript_25924/g.72592  ORF Transcript_25924/g.72592 Transcript_25924/m.72592 type:complete len:152 (+) Transcript_25924:72-527(+)
MDNVPILGADGLVAVRMPVAATVSYMLFYYYLLIGLQRKVKYAVQAELRAQGKEFDRYHSSDPRMLAADRIVGNTLEQMCPFLCSMWLYAACVSCVMAGYLGFLYLGFRILYPYLIGTRLSHMQSKRVYFATLPAYAIIFYFLVTSLLAVF